MAYDVTDTAPRVRYTATQDQQVFTVPFEFPANGDLKVYVNEVLLTYNDPPTTPTEYSVTGAATTGGGSITIGTAGSGNSTDLNDDVLIIRDIAVERLSDYPTSGIFDVTALNDELDRLTAMIQQIEYSFSQRALRFSDTDLPEVIDNLPAKADRLGAVLVFNETTGQPEASSSVGANVIAAETAAANAATSETNAAASATAAAASASSASTSAGAAATSETNAAASASAASASESAAATSETNAAASETAAAASEAAAAASYDSFDDRYLGSKASAPTLDNDGDALVVGALYWDTTLAKMRVFNGASWTNAIQTSDGIDDQATGVVVTVVDATFPRVGIGSGSFAPAAELHLKTSLDEKIRVENTGDAANSLTAYHSFYHATDRSGYIGFLVGDLYLWNEDNKDVRIGANDTEVIRVKADGKVGINDTGPVVTFSIGGTDGILIPSGTTAQRPTGEAGIMRYNTTTGAYEGHNGSAWTPVGGGGLFKGENGEVGTAPGDIFRINEQTLNTDTTIDADENASCAGPLSVASGTTLTVSSGGNLVIL